MNITRGLIYFVQGELTGLVKIGWTQLEPLRRLEALQIGSPDKLKLLGVIWGYRDWETRHHELFQSAWSHGEWFRPTPELMAYIQRRTRSYEELIREARIGRLNRHPDPLTDPLLLSDHPMVSERRYRGDDRRLKRFRAGRGVS